MLHLRGHPGLAPSTLPAKLTPQMVSEGGSHSWFGMRTPGSHQHPHRRASRPSLPPALLRGARCCGTHARNTHGSCQDRGAGPPAWRNRLGRIAPRWRAELPLARGHGHRRGHPHPAMLPHPIGCIAGLPRVPTSRWRSPGSVPTNARATRAAGVRTHASPGGTVPTPGVSHRPPASTRTRRHSQGSLLLPTALPAPAAPRSPYGPQQAGEGAGHPGGSRLAGVWAPRESFVSTACPPATAGTQRDALQGQQPLAWRMPRAAPVAASGAGRCRASDDAVPHAGLVGGLEAQRGPRRVPAAANAVQEVGNVVAEELAAGVQVLEEEEHEVDAQAVAQEQLHHQQRGADVLVDICLKEVPEDDQGRVLRQPGHVVDGQAAPVLRLVDEVPVGQLELHGRPAEHVDAGIEEGEGAEHHHRAHPAEVLLDVVGQAGAAPPELHPGQEEDHQQVGQGDGDDPVLEDGAEEHEDGHTGGDLQAAPQHDTEEGQRPQLDLVVIVLDLDGQDVADERAVGDRHQADAHEDGCRGKGQGNRAVPGTGLCAGPLCCPGCEAWGASPGCRAWGAGSGCRAWGASPMCKVQGARHRGSQQEAQCERCWDSWWLVVTDPRTGWLWGVLQAAGGSAPGFSPYTNKPRAFVEPGPILCLTQAPTPLLCAGNAAHRGVGHHLCCEHPSVLTWAKSRTTAALHSPGRTSRPTLRRGLPSQGHSQGTPAAARVRHSQENRGAETGKRAAGPSRAALVVAAGSCGAQARHPS